MYEIVSGYAAPTIVAALVAVAVFHIVGKSALECLLPKADADVLVHAPLLFARLYRFAWTSRQHRWQS
jgi:hypothetical protein